MVGGYCSYAPGKLGITEFNELPQGLYGSARASALAQVDARYDRNALIVADLSNDTSYGEQLLETFGPRVIGVHIGRHGDGMTFERRPVGRGCLPIYHVGRSHLLEALHSDLQAGRVCFADGPEARRAYAQLEALEPEMRESGIVYKCLPGQHDDLGISCAMLNWAAHHPAFGGVDGQDGGGTPAEAAAADLRMGCVYVTRVRRLSAPLSTMLAAYSFSKFARDSLPTRTLVSKVIRLRRSSASAALPPRRYCAKQPAAARP